MSYNQPSKTQAGAPDTVLPGDYKNVFFPTTKAYEQILEIQPLTGSSSIVVNSTAVKIQFDLPNVLAIKLNEIWLSANYTVNFTSTSGSDTYTTIQPAFVPWRGPSSIERITLTIGSNVAFDYYGNALANNIMFNMSQNAISRNDMQFMGVDGQPQGGTSAQPLFTRFKLRYWNYDHLNSLGGILPTGYLDKMTLSLYFTAPPNCCWYAGNAVGTVNLNYQLDNLTMYLTEVADPGLFASLKTLTVPWTSREFYYQSTTLINASTQSIQIPCSFKYVRAILFVLRRQQDIQNIQLQNKLSEYSPDVSNILRLNVKVNGVRRQLQDFTRPYDWLYELKHVFPD